MSPFLQFFRTLDSQNVFPLVESNIWNQLLKYQKSFNMIKNLDDENGSKMLLTIDEKVSMLIKFLYKANS